MKRKDVPRNINQVPLDQLKPGRANVRMSGRDEGLAELVASIRAKGLLQPLVVRAASGGGYEVTAGNRRLAALQLLAAEGAWSGLVPVMIREESDDEARDTSLAENVARVPMHPIDEYQAFAALNLTADEIAARYGITAAAVRQRLALGRLHRDVRDAWRAGKIDGDTARAFTLSRTAARQAAVLSELQKSGRLYRAAVRQAFVADRPRTDDGRVVFVGLEAYTAAGGEVDEDLFAEHGYVRDPDLLDRLVAEKLKEECRALERDGWGFAAAIGSGISGSLVPGAPAGTGEPTEAEAKRLKAIAVELGPLDDRPDDESWDAQQRLHAEYDELTKRIQARGYTAEQKAKLGCVLKVDEYGLAVSWGVKPGARKASDGPPSEITPDDVKPDPRDPLALPLLLVGDMGAVQSQAVAQCLEVVPSVAVKVAVAALRTTSGPYGRGSSPVRLKAEGLARRAPSLGDRDDDAPTDEAGVASSGFAAALAALTDDEACLELARELSVAIDCRNLKYNPVSRVDLDALLAELPARVYAAKVSAALSLEDYFKRAPAAAVVAALEEMGDKPLKDARKSVLVERAVELGRAQRWIPPLLRHPSHAATLARDDEAPSAGPAGGAA